MHQVLEVPFLHLEVWSYSAMLLLAIAVCHAIGPGWARVLEGLNARATRRAMVLLGVAAFGGGRLHLVANYWPRYAERPLDILRLWGGLHAGGAVVAMVVAAPFIFRRCGVPPGRFADALVPTVGIGIAIARLGCFLQGCCFGVLCRWPWGVSFPIGSEVYAFHAELRLLPPGAGRTLPVHPLQLYFAAAGLLITAVALWLHPRKRYDGEPALVGLVLFSLSAAVLEFFRADMRQRVYWGPLPQLEWVALAMTAASVVALCAVEVRYRRRARSHDGLLRAAPLRG